MATSVFEGDVFILYRYRAGFELCKLLVLVPLDLVEVVPAEITQKVACRTSRKVFHHKDTLWSLIRWEPGCYLEYLCTNLPCFRNDV